MYPLSAFIRVVLPAPAGPITLEAAQGDLAARAQRGLAGDADAVDVGAVARPEVADVNLAGLAGQFGMLPRNHWVIERQIGGGIAPDHHAIPAERHRLAGGVAEGQFRAAQQPLDRNLERSEIEVCVAGNFDRLPRRDAIVRGADGGAVGGLQVFDQQTAGVFLDEPGVISRDHGVGEHLVVVLVASDADDALRSGHGRCGLAWDARTVRSAHGRRSGRRLLLRPLQRSRGAQRDDICSRHPDRLMWREPLPVHVGSVGGAQIFDGETLFVFGEQAVAARDDGVRLDDVALRGSADCPDALRLQFAHFLWQ